MGLGKAFKSEAAMISQAIRCPLRPGFRSVPLNAVLWGLLLLCALPTHAEDDFLADLEGPGEDAAAETTSPWRGLIQMELADTYASPRHISKARTRVELVRSGKLGQGLKYKIGGRYDYDAVYSIEDDFYPAAVRDDRRSEFSLREFYLDVPLGDVELRLGKQQIVWGEMIGLFFADVVSAKDLREFVLPEFDQLRIPQWAARAEYFSGDFHAEIVVLPYAQVDRIDRPGGDFFPFVPDGAAVTVSDREPNRSLADSNYGVRVGNLIDGWDLSGFYYRSLDAQASYFRSVTGTGLVFQPSHTWIHQYGGTFSKDVGFGVFRGEAVYTIDRLHSTTSPFDGDGLVRSNVVDWALGIDLSPSADSRINFQLFQRLLTNHSSFMLSDKRENGLTALYNQKFGKWEGEVLLVHSLNRTEWMLRPKIAWNFERNWRWSLGVDAFKGPSTGFFGRYDQRDRVYTELRYSF